MKEDSKVIIILKETTKYLKMEKSTLCKMSGEGNIPVVKIEFGKDDKVIIHVPFLIYAFNICLKKNLGYIQKLLGRQSSKTTDIYTHVSKKNLSAIKNPLNSLMAGGEA